MKNKKAEQKCFNSLKRALEGFEFEIMLPLMTWRLLQGKGLSLSCCYELRTWVTGQLCICWSTDAKLLLC